MVRDRIILSGYRHSFLHSAVILFTNARDFLTELAFISFAGA